MRVRVTFEVTPVCRDSATGKDVLVSVTDVRLRIEEIMLNGLGMVYGLSVEELPETDEPWTTEEILRNAG